MKLLPESCSSNYVINLAANYWEREYSCNQTRAKIQKKPEQECVRSASGESEHESSSPLSRPLFEGNWAGAPKEEPGTTVRKPLEKVGPRSHWPWVGRPQGGPLVPPFGQVIPQRSWTLKIWCTAKSCSKRCPNYFSQKILKLWKYFFWSFCKKGKVLEKIPACRKQFWKFQTCSGEKQIRCKENVEKRRKQIWDKYQFTFGKGASFKVRRARLFSTILTIRWFVLENWTRPNSRPSATPSFPSSFF